jgi:GNAT superfamily N-acetyltransferase
MDRTVSRATIRPMRAADAVEAADLLRRGDFGERLDFFAWALTQPTVNLLVAVQDGRIVGTGTGSAHGHSGWVGVIFVAPDRRGTGLGRSITRAVIDDLEARGCRTQVLIASPMGRPIYEREGFTALDHQVRFTIDGLPPGDGPKDPRVRPYVADDFDGVAALDRYATGEDRRAVLRALVTPESTLVAVDGGGAVRGFLARTPWRGGGLIATDPDDALRLLEHRRRSTGISGKAGAGVLASNTAGRERLRAAGWHEEIANLRMIRGEPLDWHPDAIFGQFNGALG